MNMEEQLKQVDSSIAECKHLMNVRDSLVKLQKNRDFKKVILESYFKEEAARLVMAKSSDLGSEHQDIFDRMIYGVGSLAKFLDMVITRGDQAEEELASHEEAKVLILQEGLA